LTRHLLKLFIESFAKRPGLGKKLAEPLLIAVS
jgi:hypothetical protein